MEEYNSMIKFMKTKIERLDSSIEELQAYYLEFRERGYEKDSPQITQIRLKIEYLKGKQQAHLDILADTIRKRDKLIKHRRLPR